MRKLTTSEFIKKANQIHNNYYNYSKSKYVNAHTKIKIICPKHGEFWQKPNNHIHLKQKCAKCIGQYKPSTKEFIQKVKKIHNNKYDYSLVIYKHNRHKIKIICPHHGIFLQEPSSHLRGQNCPYCTNKKIDFINLANKTHNNRYKYPNKYINSQTKIKIICEVHGAFYQRPCDHINKKTNCPTCARGNYSQKAISWLESIIKTENIHIQHAENKGEYNIPTTKYKADGYCEINNTIYEFYGDCWHGNLELYKEDEQCHPFSDECAGSLYIKTMQREQVIKNLGYNLITIWENDYGLKVRSL